MVTSETEPWHGTSGGYGNHKCRCAECRAAWAASVAVSQERRSKRPVPEHVHGTQNGYGNYKCRCAPCTAEWARATLDRYHRRRAKQACPS